MKLTPRPFPSLLLPASSLAVQVHEPSDEDPVESGPAGLPHGLEETVPAVSHELLFPCLGPSPLISN